MMTPGACVVVEHKTTSSDIDEGSVYWKRLRLDAQISTYLVGARALGFEPRGVLYDVIRKPSTKLGLATPLEERKYTKGTKSQPSRLYANQRETDETEAEYRVRARADIEANPDTYFRRGEIVRHVQEEIDAAADAWATAEQITAAQNTHRFPRNVDACERYGRFCDYWEVCTGQSNLQDPTRYRRATTTHEELEETGKRHLPVVTASATKCFRRCEREYYFSYELGFRPLAKSEALEFGTLVHKGLEVWWKTVDLASVFAVIAKSTEDVTHLVNAQELLRGYHARWSEERLDVLAVEAQFVAPLVDPATGQASSTWSLGGKIDAVARVAA